jgi:O-acetyl-ADP-ribose deacetylase (regulator of RNase III)
MLDEAAVNLSVVRGDITQQHVDAVVNAANTRMRGGGGVDGAIHRSGGPAILADCIDRFPSGLATGQAGWTTAGDLPATWVIHVVGPVYTGEDAAKRHQLSSCYTNALRVADELQARTVAFPLVSAGAYGWPVPDAARAAIQALGSVATNVKEARLVAFSASAYDALVQALPAGT